MPSRIGTCRSGRGKRYRRRNCRKRVSSALSVGGASTPRRCKTFLRTLGPRRPLASRASSLRARRGKLVIRRLSAHSRADSTRSASAHAPRFNQCPMHRRHRDAPDNGDVQPRHRRNFVNGYRRTATPDVGHRRHFQRPGFKPIQVPKLSRCGVGYPNLPRLAQNNRHQLPMPRGRNGEVPEDASIPSLPNARRDSALDGRIAHARCTRLVLGDNPYWLEIRRATRTFTPTSQPRDHVTAVA